jgi:exosortase
MSTPTQIDITLRNYPRASLPYIALSVILFIWMYWRSFDNLLFNWQVVDSYYSHGFLIPPISIYFIWAKRKALLDTPIAPTSLGIPVLLLGALLLLIGDFLGFALFAQLSMIPTLAGLILIFLGINHTRLLWFPLFFLLFMIPIPYSLTTAISFQVKLIATESAVELAQLMTLPMIRDGSYVYFGDDRLLVGEVCGGLRSLIALLAFGTIMSYISKTKNWARVVILAVAGPVAVIANILRILFLCIVGYTWGSKAAVGTVHDVSGIMIFAVAFVLLFTIESILRKIAPQKEKESKS